MQQINIILEYCNSPAMRSVAPFERDSWNDLPKAQIVLKSSDGVNKTNLVSGPLSKYMRVENSEIVLDDHVMLNSQDGLIVDDGV
ncbi:unnamed protein product [Rhizophagus irregularis]|nr:unnamed protein product [Rhizophagus irregularis]